MMAYPKLSDSLWLSSDEEGEIGEDFGEYGAHVGDVGRQRYQADAIKGDYPASNFNSGDSSVKRNRRVNIGLHSSTPHNSQPRSNETLSLSDFEDEYFVSDKNRSKPHPKKQKHMNSSLVNNNKTPLSRFNPLSSHFQPLRRRAESGDGVRVWSGEGVKQYWRRFAAWLSKSSKWKVIVLGCLLGLLCAIGVQRLRIATASNDNHILCADLQNKQPCLTAPQLKPTLLLAQGVRDHLHTRAGLFECGDVNVSSLNVSLKELLPPSDVDRQLLHHVLYLHLANPHWNIRWLDFKGEPVTSSPNMEDILYSTSPQISLTCRVALLLTELWSIFRTIVLVLLAIVAIVAMAMWYIHKREREMTAMYIMVEKILEILRQHYEATRKQKDLLPYLAIIHVRDMLIQPSERQRKQRVWERACAWVAQHESRVRMEQRRIAGEDFQVWRWIQVDPPKTEEPPSDHDKRKNFWQGSTLEEYTPGALDAKFAPPAGSPSRCIRLKNMFEAISHMDDEQSLEIQNSVLDRCVPYGNVVHVYIDRKSTFGCVYMKMDSLQAAKGAYKSLHGGWYKGKLVTAKFIPEPKYHKWFPHSAKATAPLYPN